VNNRLNPMLASAQRVVTVTVEYDGSAPGRRLVYGRKCKRFTGARAVAASRAFYARMLRDGRNPRVVGATRNGETLPVTPAVPVDPLYRVFQDGVEVGHSVSFSDATDYARTLTGIVGITGPHVDKTYSR
jgi:hypothetical protein